jgi:signal transduction histidine kinase
MLVRDEETGRSYLAGANIDITERKRNELLLTAQNRILSMIASDRPLAQVLESLVQTIEAIKPGARCAILLVGDSGQHLRVGTAPSLPLDLVKAIDGISISAGDNPVTFGLAAASGKRIVIEDINASDLRSDLRMGATALGLMAVFSTPILNAQSTILGTLDVFLARTGAPTEHDLRVVEFAVQIAAIAIESAASRQRLQKANDELDRKVIERTRELHSANEQLRDLDRLKSNFLSSMSHELRTPLNAVIGFTDNLLMRAPGPLTADQERQLGIVRSSAQTLLMLISDLLDMAKLEADRMSLRPVRIVCQEVLADVIRHTKPAASAKGLRIVMAGTSVPGAVNCDPDAVLQILDGLLRCAIRLTTKGDIAISVIEKEEQGRHQVAIGIDCQGFGTIPAADVADRYMPSRVDPATSDAIGTELYQARRLTLLIGGLLAFERSDSGAGRITLLIYSRT